MTDQLTELLKIVKASDSETPGKFATDFEDAMEKIDSALTTTILKVTAGTGGLLAYRIVYITSLGTALAASNANPTHMGRVIGMTVEAISESETGLVRRIGRIENESWSLIPGTPYFLGEGGEIINTVPESGFIQYVGVAESIHVLALSLGIPVKRN
jgi:hypothetical protein